MLSGNSQSIVAAAVESVIPWVDELCLIDTGITDNTIHRVATIAGEKFHLASFPWCNDFAAARNAAFSVAQRRAANWALTIDTDERLRFPGCADHGQLHQALNADSTVQAWTVLAENGSYGKERFIRLPTSLQWHGRTHETLTSADPFRRRRLDGCHFWEIGKTANEQHHKLLRDLQILLEETTAEPLNSRWWYYLGQTYERLKEFHQAIEAFDRCFRLDGWPEESAWACYAAARCLVALGEYRAAEEYCGLGMTRQPASAELPWLAGWCCFQRGALQQSVTWCKLAIVLGRDVHSESSFVFRHVPAWFEGPYDVLRHVFRELGTDQDADNAEQDYQAAKAHRLSRFPSSE